MDFKYKVGQQVIVNDFDKSMIIGLELENNGAEIYVDEEEDEIFLISRDDVSRIPKTITIRRFEDWDRYPAYSFYETDWKLYEFMISPINKYLVEMEL